MKKAVLLAALTLGVLILGTAGWWGYQYVQYRQHLPTLDLVVNDVAREYHIYVPRTDSKDEFALVVLLQGGDAGSWRFAQQHRWEALADKLGVILVQPVGYKLPHNEGAWQLDTHAGASQDVEFISAMLKDVAASYAIDERKVYAVGYSMGSMFSYELACQMSGRFIAIASHAGSMPIDPRDCNPTRHVPIMHLHGVDDPIIAYSNRWDWKAWPTVGTMQDVPGLIDYWSTKYACKGERVMTENGATHFVYADCEQGGRIEHYKIEDIGHDWPDQIFGRSTHQVIWDFFTEVSATEQPKTG